MARKPDFWVKAMDKRVLGKVSSAKVGAAWKNSDGSISIDLNPFTTLETVSRSPKDLVITLFPVDRSTPISSDEPPASPSSSRSRPRLKLLRGQQDKAD
jgi:hypothetical protein